MSVAIGGPAGLDMFAPKASTRVFVLDEFKEDMVLLVKLMQK
ncbi:hypothetical protein EV05_0752 [Prochlorococcus sp. MIT 0601]|nr:hypothetical protein EV05_0752 [Prochlorococcus sp. MIT 0601]